ncbi:MAG: ABC transporter ATP-binding protein [Shimia sp.]|uniref:ABC transporter ATP-binding protein n=1 Tax=Shimia sp. TaxID=1954381 RepID=UPI001B03455E|nr:ABC transporter ATP-binding protein [Shimia sp.]MBO6896987.1 ABC transporter ATP-binding protein [Shimia sp.]
MTAAVEIKDVAFSWRGRTAFSLAVPEFSVAAGDRVFLLGESGSGKSTFLSLICGINLPDRGDVAIAGTSLSDLKPAARDRFRAENIGVIFQMFNLLPYASPLENILLPLSFAPNLRRRIKEPTSEALRLTRALGLPDALVLRAGTTELSIGQQQRVAAARALIGQPKLILADEPTSSLDASAQEAFVALLMEQAAAVGATLIMVSHDQRLAAQFDRQVDLADIAQVTRGDR